MLPEAALDEAETIAQRVAAELARTSVPAGHSHPIVATASIGIATRTRDDATLCDLIARADAAMYAAKDRGAS